MLEETIEEPHNRAYSKEEWEEEWHVLNTLAANHLPHNTKGSHKDTQWENEANPSKDQEASTSTLCYHQGEEDNGTEPENMEEEKELHSQGPSLFGCVHEEQGKVDGFNEATKTVDGDEEDHIGLDEGVE